MLKWKQPFTLLLILAVLSGVGFGLVRFGWSHVRTDQKLAKSSAVIDGRVISSSSRPLSKGGQSLTLVVEYLPPNQGAITKTFDVDGSDYTTAQKTGKARVTYLPDDPRVSRVTHFAVLPFQILIGLGSIMVLSGLFWLFHALKASPARR